jgi:GTPase
LYAKSNVMAHKAGYVNIIGNPNVGKSTLMNALVGERLSIITSKAQTTRHRILGIVNGDDFQILFSDTPGIIKPAYELQNSMMDFVKSAFEDADILIYMVEVGEKELKDEAFFYKIIHSNIPVLLLLNKIDKSNQEQLEEQVTLWKEKVPNAEIFPISALNNFNVAAVFDRILELLPDSPPYYPKDALTDKPERFFVNEAIREKILLNYDKEIPYAVEVETEEFKEEEEIIRIKCVIMVERNSQKGIIIGHKGEAIKKVGTQARIELEKFFAKKVHIELFVKVNKDWRNSDYQLRRFGYSNK